MADNTIDSLSIEIGCNASGASRSITNLCNRLDRLDRTTFSGIKNLKRYSRQMNELNKAARKLNSVKFNNKLFDLKTPNLSNFLANIKNVSNSSQRAIPQVKNFSRNLSSIESNAQKGSSGLSKLLSNIKKMLALKISFSGFKDMFEKSSELLEDFNYFDQAFNQVAEKSTKTWSEAGFSSAEEYANSFSKKARELTSKMSGFDISDTGILSANKTGKSLGMDPSLLLNAQATFAQISSSMGTTSEQATNLSDALTMLGADLASLRNEDFSKVYDNLTSGLTGMSRAVDKYGINIRVANLQQEAANLGIQTSVSNMSQADKVLLRTIVMLESSKGAWTDLSRTISLPANQMRIFKNNLAMISRLLGNIFLPIVAKVLPYINGLAIAFQRLLMGIGNLTGANKQIGQMYGGITKGSDVLSDALDAVDDTNLSGLNDTTADANDNLKSAAKNAKKLKQFLSSYDELEVMSKNDDSSTSLGSTKLKVPAVDTSALDSSILNDKLNSLLGEYQKQWDAAYNSMENKAMAFANKVQSAFEALKTAADPTTQALQKLWNEGLKQFGNFTWTSLKDFWKHFLKPLGKWTLGKKGLPRLINAFNNFLTKIKWGKINESLRKFWDALEPLAENVGTGILNFFDDLSEKASKLVNKLPGGIDKITELIKKIKPETAQKVGYAIGQIATSLLMFKGLKSISGIIGNSGIGKFISQLVKHPLLTIAGGITAIVLALDKFGVIDIDWSGISQSFENLKERVVNFAKKIDWKTVSNDIQEGIKTVTDKIFDFIDKIDWNALWEGLTNTISTVWTGIKDFADSIHWDTIKDGLSKFAEVLPDLAAGFGQLSADIINKLADAFDWLMTKLSTLDPDTLEKIGYGLGVIFAVKIGTDLAGKILNVANSFSSLGIALKGLKWLVKSGSALAKGLGAVLASGFGAAAIGAGLGLAATEKTVDDKGKERQFEEQSNNAKTASENLLEVLKNLDERGAITSQTFDTLSTKLNSFVAGTSTTTIFTSMRDAMIEAGISSDDLAVSINNTGGNLEEFYNLVAHASDGAGNAGGQIKSFAEAINTVNPDPLVSKLYSLQTAEEQVTFADLIIQSSNAIDEMGGIWENGKQILGDKAIAIYQAIQDGLEPDENGFYKIGEDQMVQFGNAIDDSGKTLKDKTQSTLSDPLKLAISEVLPEYSTFGADAKGWFITGLTGTDAATDLKVQEAFKKVLEGIDTKYTEDIGKTTGKNMTGGITKGMEENSQTVKDATNKMVDDGIKTPAQDSLGIHSPSKWFENLAKFCGSGFENGLDIGFDGAFKWFEGLRAKINNSIGSLHSIGWNAIIGMNNGMVEAATQHLYKNAQAIAESIVNKFRTFLKINSPSRVMAEIGGFTVEGMIAGIQSKIPRMESTIQDISNEIKRMQTPPTELIPQNYFSQKQRFDSRNQIDMGGFMDTVEREIIAISSNVFNNNEYIEQAVRNSLNGMAIYADGHLIGYLQEEDRQCRNRSGVGLFEG